MNGEAATVFTHRRPQETAGALERVTRIAERHGITLRFSPEETRKHGLRARPGIVLDAPVTDDVRLCVTLGGDGTILQGLRAYASTGVPVFAVNFGELGFLATVEPAEIEVGFERALDGQLEQLSLPAIGLGGGEHAALSGWKAFNDVSIHRRRDARVAQLSYALGSDEVGRVRCDGLVVATPAGSTGYTLANGGPVLAWGVEGYVVSFIAPHSLTARALVVAPGDPLTLHNLSQEEPVDVVVDGRDAGELGPRGSLELGFLPDQGLLLQIPGTTFYHRLREKFGRLAY